ncbi:MAG: 3-phosphoshikimate 1-carboxyvinyltransferase [Gemmatimonadota bacterium]
MIESARDRQRRALGRMLTIQVPGDKSISHRVLMLAPFAAGASRLSGLSQGADVAATAAAMRALGALPPDWDPRGEVTIDGPRELKTPAGVIDCGNSGTTARLLLGLVAGSSVSATLDGDASLRSRPMSRAFKPLVAAGAQVRQRGQPGRLPLEIRGGGGALEPIEHATGVASAQVKGALLLAGLSARVPVTVVEPAPSRDHTERLLRQMGASVESGRTEAGYRVHFSPPAELVPFELKVPGDFSAAAFWLGLAVLGGAGPGLRIESVGMNPLRTGFMRALEAMGADIEVEDRGEEAGEPVADIVARRSALTGLDLPPDWIPTLLDEIPILACVAAQAGCRLEIRGASELRVKESDRIAVLFRNLSRLRVEVKELDDGLIIEGSTGTLSGVVEAHADHRIAMAFAVLGALPENSIEIDDASCVDVSYPDFWETLAAVSGGAG